MSVCTWKNNSVRIHSHHFRFCSFFPLIFSPNASLMWPLRPHLVFSSTGLNHKISSDTGEKKRIKSQIGQSLWFMISKHHPLTSVKEHVADNGGAAVDFERMSAENNPLQHHTLRITTEQSTCSHEVLDAWEDAEAQTNVLTQHKSRNPKSSQLDEMLLSYHHSFVWKAGLRLERR